MGNVLEDTFSQGFLQLVGDPLYLGIGVYGFFLAAVFLWPTHPSIKALAFFGATMLAIPFLGLAWFVWGFGIGVIIWFAVRRFWG